jgi:hypothetical protein
MTLAANGLGSLNAGDLLGRPIEACDPPVLINRKDPVADAVNHCLESFS